MPDTQPTVDVSALGIGVQSGATIGEGRYRVIEKLGEGGMGSVYAAEDLRLHRKVAVKVLHEQNAEARARLMAEVELLASLHDPRVVAVTDLGEVDSSMFMVTEFLQGVTLEKFVEGWMAEHHGPIPVPLALRIGSAIAGALSAVHSVGYIHRDLKPANLMLKESKGTIDWLKLIDFGLSARSGVMASREGTPDYVAPETLESNEGGVGGVIGEGTDLYSLGCLLFELVSGRRPFEGTTESMMKAHLSAPRPRVQSGLPDIDDLVEKLMAVSIKDRPDSAKWVATELLRLEAKLAREGTLMQRAPAGPTNRLPDRKASETIRVTRDGPTSAQLASEVEAGRRKSRNRTLMAVTFVVALALVLFFWPRGAPMPQVPVETPVPVEVVKPAPKDETHEPVAAVVAPKPVDDQLSPLSPTTPKPVKPAPVVKRIVITEKDCVVDDQWRRGRGQDLNELSALNDKNRSVSAVAMEKAERELQKSISEAQSSSDCVKVTEALDALSERVLKK